MKQMFSDLKLPLLLIALMSLCATIALPIMPVDETRYLSAAWEMWNGHSFLVPLLNGAPYSHKPPLLFWLIHASWALFGVNDFTPRLIPGVFSLLSLILVYRISLRLWPQERKTAVCAALILASTTIWDVWSVAIMFDMVFTFWILLGLLGTLRTIERQRGGWLMLTAGIAGGLLTKGPAVYVYLLSIPLLRGWWDTRKDAPVRARWYLSLLGSTVLGFVIALLWAVPAMIQGGEAYRHAILWGQTAKRITSAFAHRRPFWWYLPIVPSFFFPWILFRPAFTKLELKSADSGTRFCIVWLGLPLLIFSMISGKQIHYLIPFIPAGALLIGRNIARAEDVAGKISVKVIGGLFLLLGLVALAAPYVIPGGSVGIIKQGDTLVASLGLLTAGLLLLRPFRSASRAVKRIALCLTLVLLCALFEAKKNFMDDYDVKETAVFIKGKMDEGLPVVNIGNYHGQYHFPGRLTQPLNVLFGNAEEIRDFAKSNSGTLFVSYPRENEYTLPEGVVILFTHEYRGNHAVLWQFSNGRP